MEKILWKSLKIWKILKILYFSHIYWMIHSATFDGYKINIPSSFHSYTVLKVIGNGGSSIVALVENQNQ